MDLLIDSFISAILLVVSLDGEMISIVGVSLKVSCTSTFFAALIGVPVGFAIAFSEFSGKHMVITVLNTLLALPTVVIGLLSMPLFPAGESSVPWIFSIPKKRLSLARLF